MFLLKKWLNIQINFIKYFNCNHKTKTNHKMNKLNNKWWIKQMKNFGLALKKKSRKKNDLFYCLIYNFKVKYYSSQSLRWLRLQLCYFEFH